ncbi:MAG: hypothetical protein COT17_03540 [Elusimicrobia bacterium CG08_land_8_20_14_0_20_51_18]|nr:MAG: hypothetical protein COT17_03540 [Elusimicrobia bacterium CG08_land_8_20_14_0_20_51_18]
MTAVEPQAQTAAAVAEPAIKIDVEEIIGKIKNTHPKRHFRYIPTITECPVEDEIIKKFDSKRPALIIGENIELIKLYKTELSKLGINAVTITSQKSRMRDLYSVNFDDLDEVENALKEITLKYPDLQGLIYLMGCMDKKLANDSQPFKDLKRYAMPLFLAAKYFNKELNEPRDGNSTFVSIITTLDGGFGYSTRENYDPVYAAIFGISLCLRKELDKAVVKLIDFPKDYGHNNMVKKSFYETQYSDLRHAVCYNHNKRFTMLARPNEIDDSRERYSLKGKKVMITGGGRGLGSLFAKIIAHRWKPGIVILDIIELNEKSAEFAAMSPIDLEDYKKTTLWTELKAKLEKATPAILEKEFTRIKDGAALYRTIEELKALGSKVEYHRCDLNDQAQFAGVMENIKARGKLDGAVHFAGLERSKLIADKTLEEFFMIFNTKAQSALNLWRAEVVKDNGFWAMISSIAGKFGNLGQSDYAAASDYISKFAINLFNQGNRAFSIDMTGIANIGMGVRPGVEAFLKSQNMEFLYPEEVMNALADEIVYGDSSEAILSGDLGKLDWDKQLQYEPDYPNSSPAAAGGAQAGEAAGPSESAQGLHFMEKIEKNSKSDGFLASKKLAVETDHYLTDHAINGTPVFPGVMGIETFAEAVKTIKKENPKTLLNLRFQLPIKLLKNNPVDIKIIAKAEDKRHSLRIESDFINSRGVKMGETRIHFLGEYDPEFKARFDEPELPAIKSRYKVDAGTIYKTYFHGPSFQVLDGIISADKERVFGVFKRPAAPLLGEKDMDYIFHPMLIEAMFQTCGWRDLYLENKMTLPDAIGEITVADNARDAEKLYTLAVFKGMNDYGKSIYDSYAFDEKGKLAAQLKDYVMIPTQI